MKQEAIVIAPKENKEKLINDIISERIGALCKENGIEVDYAVEEIAIEYSIRENIVKSVARGIVFFVNEQGNIEPIYGTTMLIVLKIVAEYFNTSTDYLLGLTDRMY